jgi:hypothetical protein
MVKKPTKKTQTTGEGTVDMPKVKEKVLFGVRVIGTAEKYIVGQRSQVWPMTGLLLDSCIVTAVIPTPNGVLVQFEDHSEEHIMAPVGMLYREM